MLLRGDTDFTQTKHLDRWSDDQRVQFIFGVDCTPNLRCWPMICRECLAKARAAGALPGEDQASRVGRRTSRKRSS